LLNAIHWDWKVCFLSFLNFSFYLSYLKRIQGEDQVLFFKFKNVDWEFLVRRGQKFVALYVGYRKRNVPEGFHLKMKITVSLMNRAGLEPVLTKGL
jgi:hypothetical protein